MSKILINEINEQAACIARLVQNARPEARRIAQELKGRFDYILVTSRGSSENAGRYAQYLMQTAAGYPVALTRPSIYTLYERPPQLKNALMLGISQSGASPDLLAVFREARAQGRPTVLITNTPDSPMAQISDYVLDLNCGKEYATAATKSYTATLAAIALLAEAFQPEGGLVRYADLQALPAQLEQVLQRYNDPQESPVSASPHLEKLVNMPYLVVLGRGYNNATAFEIELKLKELSGLTTVAYSAADFLHGPIACIQPGYPVLGVLPRGATLGPVLETMRMAQARGAWLAMISDDPGTLALADMPMWIPEGIPEYLSPVSDVIPGQFLGMALGAARGVNVDQPDGIHKVTETW